MIYCYHRAAGDLPVLAAVLWLLLPVVDCLRGMARVRCNSARPRGGQEPLHHRLARYWRWPICLAIYLAVVIVPGSIGALWPDTSLAMIVVSLTCYAGLLMLTSVVVPLRTSRRPALIWRRAGRRAAHRPLTARMDRPR